MVGSLLISVLGLLLCVLWLSWKVNSMHDGIEEMRDSLETQAFKIVHARKEIKDLEEDFQEVLKLHTGLAGIVDKLVEAHTPKKRKSKSRE